eukprot:746435-Hanusia_phi.AAC.3
MKLMRKEEGMEKERDSRDRGTQEQERVSRVKVECKSRSKRRVGRPGYVEERNLIGTIVRVSPCQLQ